MNVKRWLMKGAREQIAVVNDPGTVCCQDVDWILDSY